MFGDPVMMQVMRNLVQPTFKGVRDEWPKFVVQWEKFLAKLSQGKPISDELKLQLLEPCLDEINRGELHFLQKISHGSLTFGQFWAKLTTRYGDEINSIARRKWRDLVLPTNGMVLTEDWRDFEVKFCDIWHDITDANDEEAYQILQGKLQPFMVNWLIEEQEKRKVRAPKALVSQIDGVTSETLGHNIETAVGEKPRQVGEKPNGDYIVECRDQKQLQKLMAMNGKKLRGGKYMRIQKLEQHLSTPETFEFIGRKLETRDKVD
jgi:hypothetical protein